MASNYVVAGSVGRFLHERMSSIGRHIIESMDDPIMRGIAMNSERVESTIGRPPAGTKSDSSEFQAIHPVQFGRSGTIEYAPVGDLLRRDTPPMLSKSTTYPSANTVPQRTYDWMLIPLKWLRGNLTIDERQALSLEKGEMVEDFLANWLTDPWQTIMQQCATDFFGSGYGVVAQLAAAVTTVASGATGTATLTRSVRGIWRGMRLTIWDNTSGLPNATRRGGANGTWVVTAVSNYDDVPTITILNEGTSDDLEIDDHLVLKGAWDGSVASGVQGMQLFTDNTAAIHGLSKTTYPELKSYGDDNSGTDREPTPQIFQKAFDRFHDRGFPAPTRVATTRGVRSLYYLNEGLYKAYNTDIAQPVQPIADGGIGGAMKFTNENDITTFEISPFCPAGNAYMYRPDAFIHYAPHGTDSIRFLGSSSLLGGGGGVTFMPSISGDGDYTTVFEAPFNFWFERGCTAPQSLGRIQDLKELEDVV